MAKAVRCQPLHAAIYGGMLRPRAAGRCRTVPAGLDWTAPTHQHQVLPVTRTAPFAPIAFVCAAGLLAGCMTPLPPVSATRFHRIDATHTATPGSYAIRSGEGLALAARPDPSFAAAVSRQLDLLGYRASASADAADYIVDVAVDQGERERIEQSPVSVGVGGSTGSYGSGIGVGVGLNLNRLLGGGSSVIVTTRLMVRMSRRGEDLALWEGRADVQTRARTPAAQPALNADKLATALFQGFPGNSGETISVP